jgi:hypothetical protein
VERDCRARRGVDGGGHDHRSEDHAADPVNARRARGGDARLPPRGPPDARAAPRRRGGPPPRRARDLGPSGCPRCSPSKGRATSSSGP